MTLKLHPEAEAEFNEAIDYYENAEPGLGRDFAVEVYSAVKRILAMPKAWPVLEDNIRRALVRRFPFGILYVETENEILILAIMHLHRKPTYWKNRI